MAGGQRGEVVDVAHAQEAAVGRREARAINRRWRGKDYAPNVLSFPVALPAGVASALLGDLVICAPVVAAEARAQGKAPAAHWAHMVVHGVLHLLGHDHMKKPDAARMERLERRILAGERAAERAEVTTLL